LETNFDSSSGSTGFFKIECAPFSKNSSISFFEGDAAGKGTAFYFNIPNMSEGEKMKI